MAAFGYNINSPRRASIIKDMRSHCELALDSRRHEGPHYIQISWVNIN